ncbi:MAG: DUF1573 domain-containing protein [Clostridium sp.]|nr:DUF1573 domain-containing protein [Prevotella sp.]MCM1429124.1 DUF1573 domain-containing protein [Clostridium sp.]MCM1475348.1 DUF1573 domain-containing protein [Muribaculaceae bacterium]
MIRLLSSLILLIVVAPSYAEYNVKLLNTDYDFGVIKEAAGSATGVVKMVNLGPDATYIRQVRPSCGCTGADFQQGTVAPGDTAWVSFTYNPKRRPGPFLKTVKVYTGDDNRRVDIKIRGTVIGTPESLSETYPIDLGALRLNDSIVFLSNIKLGTTRHLFVNAYNQSTDSLSVVPASPSVALDVDVYPKTIGPGDIATFSFYLNTRDLPESQRNGSLNLRVPIRTKEGEELGYFQVKAVVE